MRGSLKKLKIMYLRILEEKKKFELHKLSLEEKKRILDILSEILSRREEILVAVVYGSFISSELFRDVDIAVFTGFSIPCNKVETYEEELSTEPGSIIKLPVDVRVVDYAPPWFRARALDGLVLVEKEPALAERLKFKAYQELNDIQIKIAKIEKLLQRSRDKFLR